MTFTPTTQQVAAILADYVYHSAGETLTPPPGWAVVAVKYDKLTGYYGEAWGKLNTDGNGDPIPGSYSQIIQANRGTVIGSALSFDPNNPPADLAGVYTPAQLQTISNLAVNHGSDQANTVGADGTIIVSGTPAIMDQSDQFLTDLARSNPGIPIVEAGQSLGGAISNGTTSYALVNGFPNVTAITFNALPYTQGSAGLTDAQVQTMAELSTNYYVENERKRGQS
jgi:hypothetical protein